MPRGSWRYVIAVGLALFLASSAAAQERTEPAIESDPVTAGQQEHGGDRADSQGQGQVSDPFGISAALERIEAAIRDLETEPQQAEDERREDREIRDLDAQESMAVWAERMAWATIVGVLLTGLALWAIVRTLHHTKRAADHAETMAGEAAKATKAANDTFAEAKNANDIAKSGLIAQHRPWMVLEVDREAHDSPGWLDFLGPEKVEVKLGLAAKNIGKSPARMVLYDMKAFWTYSEWPSQDDLLALVERTKGLEESHAKYAPVVTPGDATKFAFVRMKAAPVTPRPDSWNPKHGIAIVVACCVVYKSMFSDDWFHSANLVVIRRPLPEGRDRRNWPRFGWDHGAVSHEKLEAHISKSGGSSLVT